MNSTVDDEFDLLYEFMVDFQNKIIDISPPSININSCIDPNIEWEKTKNFLIFVEALNWTTISSTPKTFYLLYIDCKNIIFSSILKTSLFLGGYSSYKLVSGIFIYGQQCSYFDKTLNYLIKELELHKETNRNKTNLHISSNDINARSNIITGICCSDKSYYSKNKLNIITEGIYYTGELLNNTSGKISLICNGNQYINTLNGYQNFDIIMGEKSILNIQKCVIGIDHFANFSNAILFIQEYRDGNIKELKNVLNNVLAIYNENGCSLNYDKTAFLFRLSGFVVDKYQSRTKQITYGDSKNLVSLKFKKNTHQRSLKK